MPCQICGKYSAFYPLCKMHFKMRDKSLVNKCTNCGVWFEGTEEKCSQCSRGVEKRKNLVHINKQAFENWAKTLYAIGKTGCEYYQNDYDKERYQRIITVSTKLYKILEERVEENPLGLTIDVLHKWSNQLYDIAKTGLKYTDNSYDIDRYNDVLSIQGEVVSAIDAVSESTIKSMEKGKEEQKPGVINQEFVTDRLIQERIIEMINRADKEILIASPWIWESEEVLEALRNVVDQKRIRVRIMTRPAKKKEDQLHKEQVRTLHKLGFQIELEEKLHAKLILIDESELLIGSANLVGSSLNRNYEASLWTNHKRTVQDAKIYFTGLMEEIFTQKLSK